MLSCGFVCVILCLAVLVEHRLVTDRHTQTETDRHRHGHRAIAYSTLASRGKEVDVFRDITYRPIHCNNLRSLSSQDNSRISLYGTRADRQTSLCRTTDPNLWRSQDLNLVGYRGGLKTRDWKTRTMKNTGVENAGLENTGPNHRGGKGRTGKRRTKFPGWKTHDHRLLNAKWISIKLKGTLYDMYYILL